jgi:hypothetical protein
MRMVTTLYPSEFYFSSIPVDQTCLARVRLRLRLRRLAMGGCGFGW